MSLNFSIHFKGELLAGHTPEQAKASLAALLRIPAAQCEAFFSGVEVVIRRGVPAGKLPLYLKRLQEIGLQVEAVPEESPQARPTAQTAQLSSPSVAESIPAPLAPAARETAAEPPAESATLPLSEATPAPSETQPATISVEEITCPKCGERQPKRTLCRQCSVDMPRYAASDVAPAPAPRHNPYASSKTALSEKAEEEGPEQASYRFFGLSFDGRMGRTDYFSACLCYLALVCFCVSLIGFSNLAGIVIFASALAILVAVVWVTRVGVLRLHDLGWSGWTLLWSFVPLANVALGLIMLFKAGDDGSNDWGDSPSSPARRRRLAASAASFVLCFVMFSYTSNQEDGALSRLDAESNQEMPTASTRFVAVPMPGDVPRHTILIVQPETQDYEEFQRAQSLADKLASHNLKVIMRSEVPVPASASNPKAQAELENLQGVLAGSKPAVFIAGKASANPSFAQVMAEYERSR